MSDRKHSRTPAAGHATGAGAPNRAGADSHAGRNFFLRVEHRKLVRQEPLLDAAGLLVYETLCLYADSMTAETFIGRREICQQTRLGPNSVRNAISLLSKLGLISVTPGQGRRPTTYTIVSLTDQQPRLPFDQPVAPPPETPVNMGSLAVPPQYHKPESVVVLGQAVCGTGSTALRYQNDIRNKDDRTVSNCIESPLPPNGGNGGAAAPLPPPAKQLAEAAEKLLTHYGWYSPLFTEAVYGAFITYSGHHPALTAEVVGIELQSKWRRYRERYRARDPNPLHFFQQGKYLDEGGGDSARSGETIAERVRKSLEA